MARELTEPRTGVGEAVPDTGATPGFGKRLRRAGWGASSMAAPVVALLVMAAVWEVWVRLAHTPVYIMPAPSAILHRLFGDPGYFAREGAITLFEALAGFGLGASVALAGAVVMAHSRYLERSLFPLAILVKVTPMVAIAPLFVIWFGFGTAPKILIAALLSFFPVLVNGMYGFRAVDPEALDFMRSLRASPWAVFWFLRMPSSLPYLFAAFRIVIPLAVIGAVVAEWFSAEAGLGAVIIVAHNNLDMPTLFAAIVALGAMGIGLTLATAAIEKRLLFWHESTLAR